MTLEQRLGALSSAVGADVKILLANQGALNTLSTTAKNSLVAAINELQAEVIAAGGGGGSSINDVGLASSTTETWSISKITARLEELRDDLLGGVPATAYDTLTEIATYLATDETATSGLVSAMALRVRVDASQAFTTIQKNQARTNISAFGAGEIGNPDADLVTLYNTAKA